MEATFLQQKENLVELKTTWYTDISGIDLVTVIRRKVISLSFIFISFSSIILVTNLKVSKNNLSLILSTFKHYKTPTFKAVIHVHLILPRHAGTGGAGEPACLLLPPYLVFEFSFHLILPWNDI